jgi:hypothetical protein
MLRHFILVQNLLHFSMHSVCAYTSLLTLVIVLFEVVRLHHIHVYTSWIVRGTIFFPEIYQRFPANTLVRNDLQATIKCLDLFITLSFFFFFYKSKKKGSIFQLE